MGGTILKGTTLKKIIPLILAAVILLALASCGQTQTPSESGAPAQNRETVLLIDSWEDQDAINCHHASPMMKTISDLREKYDLHMTVERYVTAQENAGDERFIKK